MKKVLILMDMPLLPYRVYAYNGLADRGYDLTVVSVSNENANYNMPLNFEHIRLNKKKYGGFVKLENFESVTPSAYDIIVVAPNLRMLDYYRFYNFKYWDKLIGWGHHKGRTTGNKLAEWVRWRFFRKFKALVFYDYETRKEYVEHGFEADRLFVANNTQYVDTSNIDINRERSYFLFVGRIQERKKIDLAIRAFGLLKKSINDTNLRFKIVGGGDVSKFKEIVDTEHIDGIEFTGPIYEEKGLQEVFSGAIAYLSPGPIGLGALHSFAFGVPVIICDVKGHGPEVNNCNESNSFITAPTTEAFAEKMRLLYEDKDLQSKMSKSAFDYYNSFCTIDKMVDGLDDAIKYLTNKSDS